MVVQQSCENTSNSPRDYASAEFARTFGERVTHTFFIYVFSFVITIFPIAMHFVSQELAIGCQFLLVTMMVIYFTPIAPMAVIIALLFQNLFVSIFSGYLTNADDYNFVRGYNFLTIMITWLWLFGHYAMNWRDHSRRTNQIMFVGLIAFALIGFYFVLGMAKSPSGAIIYLRNVITPMVLFQIFFLVSQRFQLRMQDFFFSLTVIVVLLGAIEAIDRKLWLDLTNGWTMWAFITESDRINLVWDKMIEITGDVPTGLLDSMKVSFLNTPLLGEQSLIIMRMSGPNIHSISYSYVLNFLALIMLFSGRPLWFLPLLPLMLLASAKGALIMLALACCGLVARKLFGAGIALIGLVVVLVLYLIIGILTGVKIGDFHVIGFMGGVFDFMSNPFGRGLGDGGNINTDFGTLDWPAYQRAGRTPFALESAIGVLLRQMGFATFALLACYFWVAFQTFKVSLISKSNLHTVLSFALMANVVNGVFQEEALFSPLALGTAMALNGHILGSFQRFLTPKYVQKPVVDANDQTNEIDIGNRSFPDGCYNHIASGVERGGSPQAVCRERKANAPSVFVYLQLARFCATLTKVCKQLEMRLRKMDIRRFYTFAKIVDIGSITRASSILNIAQPALSQQIASLETHLGKPLLIRSKRGVVPTEAGKIFYRHCQIILKQMDQAELEISTSGEAISGFVSVGLAPLSLGSLLATQLMKVIQEEYPGIILHINESVGAIISEQIMAGKMDIALIFDPGGISGVSFEPVHTEELYFVTGKSVDAVGKEFALAEAVKHPLILPSRIHTIRQVIDTALSRTGLKASVVGQTESISVLAGALSEGLGATILPRSAALAVQRRIPEAQRYRIRNPNVKVNMAICVSDQLPLSEPATVVRERLVVLAQEIASELDRS